MFNTSFDDTHKQSYLSPSQLKAIRDRLLIYAQLEYEQYKKRCKTP